MLVTSLLTCAICFREISLYSFGCSIIHFSFLPEAHHSSIHAAHTAGTSKQYNPQVFSYPSFRAALSWLTMFTSLCIATFCSLRTQLWDPACPSAWDLCTCGTLVFILYYIHSIVGLFSLHKFHKLLWVFFSTLQSTIDLHNWSVVCSPVIFVWLLHLRSQSAYGNSSGPMLTPPVGKTGSSLSIFISCSHTEATNLPSLYLYLVPISEGEACLKILGHVNWFRTSYCQKINK